MTILGIDFGTSRIKAAYWDEERGEAVMLPLGKGGRLYVPSLFHVAKDGRIRFGDEAEMMLHHDPLGVLENLKLKLDKPIQYSSNGVTTKSAELMRLLFGRLVEYAAREAKPFDGQPPEKLVLTLPSRWDYGDIYRDALEAAGYGGEVVFLREPEAAAWAWIAEAKSKPDDLLVVLDFGGGTVDWATVLVDENGHPAMIPELPPGGITAAGAHVDEGLFDEMMNRLGDEERKYALQHRSLLMDQIRQMKESQNGRSSLSGADAETLEVMLGPELFRFERSQFEQVVKREAVDQALEGIGGYVKKVIRYAKGVGKTEIACVLVGGTRMLAGLEEQVKARLQEIGKAEEVQVSFAVLGQADFATVRGAVRCGAPSWPVHIEVKAPEAQRQPSPKLPQNFVLIKGGTFMMGSPGSEVDRRDDEIIHEVKVSDFAMCRYAVTQAEWESVTGSNPSYFQGGNLLPIIDQLSFSLRSNPSLPKGDNLPVEQVSWDDCQVFIKGLHQKMGGTYRLPTEAEWEYACRAGTTTPFNTGENLTTSQANYDGKRPYRNYPRGDRRKKTVPVDCFEPNGFGLYNMHGNVMEWCSDWYDLGYYEKCKAKGVVENPAGSSTGSYRVLRGGSWYYCAWGCRSANRINFTPGYRLNYVGFRLVFVP